MSTRPLLGDLSETTRRIAWIVFLTVASLAFSRVFACAAPFVALYAAAVVLPSSDAAFSLATIWYVLQVNVGALAVLLALSLGARALGLTQPVLAAATRR